MVIFIFQSLSESFEPDLYDEILAQNEIQGYISSTNSKKFATSFILIFIYFVFFLVDLKWNEMSKAKCDNEVVNILSSKYMPLTVN